MLESDELKKDKVIGVDLASTETIGGQVSLATNPSTPRVTALTETAAMKEALEKVPNFAAQQQKLSGQEPVIKNHPGLGEYELIDDLDGLQHGTYLEATNSEGHTQSRSVVGRPSLAETAALVNYKALERFSGFGHLKNATETAKSVEVVYTLPAFNQTSGKARVVLDDRRINEFDGLEYKDEKGNVIPGFDITYSYQGHEGEYSTIDTLKQRDDFSWEKITAVMVFGSLLPNSSYRIEFPFKLMDEQGIDVRLDYHLNEYAFYDLTLNKHTTSQFNFRLSTPVFARADYAEVPLLGLTISEEETTVLPSAVQELMPRLGDLPYAISNFGSTVSIDDVENTEDVLWQGGQYIFSLSQVQAVIQEYGYSIGVDQTGRKLMATAAYRVGEGYLDLTSCDFIPYIRVYQLLVTQEFTLKAELRDKWTPVAGIVSVRGLSAENEELPVSPEQAFIVDDSAIEDGKPGKYELIIGYYLNGSEDESMLITVVTTVNIVENKQTINVYYVDLVTASDKPKDKLTPDDGKILAAQTQTLTGKGDEVYQNQLWGLEEGYELFAFDQGAKEGTYHGGEPAVDYYVYLTHQIDKIDEDHQVTRKVTFKMPDGTKQVVKQTGRIQRFGIVDQTDGEKTWSEWSQATLPAVAAPQIPGYTGKGVEAQVISLTTKDSMVERDYQPQDVSVKIKLVDEDNHVLGEEDITGKVGELVNYQPTVEIDALAEQGYLIIDNELAHDARFSAEADQEYRIILSKKDAKEQQVSVYYVDVPLDRLPIVKPASGKILSKQTQKLMVPAGESYTNDLWDYESAGYRLFKADKGALKGKYFAGSTEQQYYVYLIHQTSPLTDEHRVTRTIDLVMPDGTTQEIVQEAVATRSGNHDLVTDEDQWQPWQRGILPEYQPTSIDGYQVDSIPATEVDLQTQDQAETVTYIPQPAEAIIKFSDQFDEEIFTKTLKGVTGEEFAYDPAEEIKSLEEKGYNLEDNPLDNIHQFAAGKQTYVIKFVKFVPVTPHSEESATEMANVNEQVADEKNTADKKGIFAAFRGLF